MANKKIQKSIEELEKKFEEEISKVNEHLRKSEEIRGELKSMRGGDSASNKNEAKKESQLREAFVDKFIESFNNNFGDLQKCTTLALSLEDKAKVCNYINGYNAGAIQELTETVDDKNTVSRLISDQAGICSVMLLNSVGFPLNDTED